MSIRPHRSSLWSLSLVVTAALSMVSGSARAHFTLVEPACYSEQDALGSPQKSGPCGQTDPGNAVVPTDAVTTLIQGGMLTLTIDERIFHPGHYRIAIAPDMASLPADPPVTVGSTACGSTVIDPAPTLPVLADGVFVHTARLTGPQTIEIPLPADFTCDHCVVQVIEFMSSHPLNDPGGCFYHHCADVTITSASTTDAGLVSDGGAPIDAAVTSDSGADVDASTTEPAAASGCGCRVTRTASTRGLSLAALGLLAFLARRRLARPR